MGQIVFVVSAEQTPQHAVRQAIEQISEEKMVGMVLNRSRKRMNPYYHAYGYGAESNDSVLHDRRSPPASEQ
jgi:Mrp family chromosome partitioning ATPase